MAKLVRIKRYEPKKGQLVRRYTAFSTRFEERCGWYRVSDEVAEYLATVHQVPGDEDTPLVFDVCTEEEAQALDETERRRAEQRAQAANPTAAQPNDTGPTALSTRDLAKTREFLAARAAARSEERAGRRTDRG